MTFALALCFAIVGIGDVHALKQMAGKVEIHLIPGETKTFNWGLMTDKETSKAELRAEGDGSEFLSFPSSVDLIKDQPKLIEVSVTIPKDYPLGTTLNPSLFALERGENLGPTVLNVQMKKPVTIVVGESQSSDLKQDNTKPVVPADATKESVKVDPEPKTTSETMVDPEPTIKSIEQSKGGGCLIATAAYGTELAPQIQLLREIRDNKLLSTSTGSAFMSSFNQVYYLFSPTIADWERESPLFKESVRLFITPMVSTLSIMSVADDGSDAQVFALGLSVISLNVGLYIGLPVFGILKLRKR